MAEFKIKQLEWRIRSYRSIVAPTPIGEYEICKALKDEGGYYIYLDKGHINDVASLGEAKEYAQSEFERTIKECLIN